MTVRWGCHRGVFKCRQSPEYWHIVCLVVKSAVSATYFSVDASWQPSHTSCGAFYLGVPTVIFCDQRFDSGPPQARTRSIHLFARKQRPNTSFIPCQRTLCPSRGWVRVKAKIGIGLALILFASRHHGAVNLQTRNFDRFVDQMVNRPLKMAQVSDDGNVYDDLHAKPAR